MNAVLIILHSFVKQLFKASVTISSYRPSIVLLIALMCGRILLKIMNIISFVYFILLIFIDKLIIFNKLDIKIMYKIL